MLSKLDKLFPIIFNYPQPILCNKMAAEKRSNLASTVAGFAAPMAKLFFFPLEMLKVHMQVSDGFSRNHIPVYRNPLHAFLTIFKFNGLLSLYKGCHMVVFSSVAWSLYFSIYERAKTLHS